jgi:L-alanine-DL-glutamate epimerase-like enolase superfamily enzyme
MTKFTLRASKLDLKLRHTFTISRWSRDLAPNVLVELEAEGIVGIGEAAPNARYNESQETCLNVGNVVQSAENRRFSKLTHAG